MPAEAFLTELPGQAQLDFYRDPFLLPTVPKTPFGKYLNNIRSGGTPDFYPSQLNESSKLRAKNVVQETKKKALPREPVGGSNKMPLEQLRKIHIAERQAMDKLTAESVQKHQEVANKFNNYIGGGGPPKTADSTSTRTRGGRLRPKDKSASQSQVIVTRPARLAPVDGVTPPLSEVPPEVLAMREPSRPYSITSSVKLKPFDSSISPLKRPKTQSRHSKSLLPIPPADAFKRQDPPKSADSMASKISFGRSTRSAEGVVSREIKSADTQMLSLTHEDDDDGMVDPKERWSQIKPEMAWEPISDKHTVWLERMKSCMEGAQQKVEQDQVAAGGPSRSEVHRRCRNIWSGQDVNRPALPMVPEDALAEQYNHLVQAIKDKVYQKGQAKVAAMLEAKDTYRTGVIHVLDFKNAMEKELNMDMSDEVTDKLLEMTGAPSKSIINVQQFMDAIRLDSLPYMARPENGLKRTVPDHNKPLGTPHKAVPYGVMADAVANVKAWDDSMKKLYKNMEVTFDEMDVDNSGQIDFDEFQKSLEELNRSRGLNLTKREMLNLFKASDRDASGAISYKEFIESFQGKVSNHKNRRFVPEFLKPKSTRCSLAGSPWEWQGADNMHAKDVQKIGSRSFDPVPRTNHSPAASISTISESWVPDDLFRLQVPRA